MWVKAGPSCTAALTAQYYGLCSTLLETAGTVEEGETEKQKRGYIPTLNCSMI